MPFLETLGKKVNRAVKKTKDMSEVSRLNSAISREEAEIVSNYIEIGKLYYKEYSNVALGKLKELCNTIDASFSAIDDMKQKILRLKGMVRCENCKQASPNGTNFCSNCGSKLPYYEEPQEEQKEEDEFEDDYGEIDKE